jgi:hypothetical protein
MTYLFRMLDFPQNLTLFKPGPLSINGAPSLSDRSRCNLTATRMSVYSFQNENDGPQQTATSAARCIEGVLLPAAVGAFPRCACKFLVPHFSSFGVSKQIMRAREFFPEYVSFHYDSLKRILSGSRRFTYCSSSSSTSNTSSSSSSNTSSSSSSNKSSTHHEPSF